MRAHLNIGSSEVVEDENVDLVSAVGAIAHDLASPLAAIQGGLCFIEDFVSEPMALETLANVQTSLNQLLELRCQILDLYQQRNRRGSPAPVSLELTEFCNSTLRALAPSVRARTREVPFVANAYVRCHPPLLKQVLRNLIENAAKYSFQSSPIDVQVAVSESRVNLSVANRGMGIPPEEMDRLFHPFFRCSNAIGIEGRGIGLSIVRVNVHQMGGTVTCRSELGGETRFTVGLPNKPPRMDDSFNFQTTMPRAMAASIA